MRIIIFLILISTGLHAQIAFRNPDGLTIFAPPPAFGVTTVYDYVITDGRTQWSKNSYNFVVQVPAPKRRCKIYLWVREYKNGIQVNRKFFIFYEENS